MNTKQIGELSEAATIFHFLKKGYSVSKPLGDNQRYDLIVDNKKEFKRIQIKTGQLKENQSILTAEITHGNTQRKGIQHKSYSDKEIDAFVIYCRELDKCYYIPIKDCKEIKRVITLRLTTPKNNQSKNIRLAQTYEL